MKKIILASGSPRRKELLEQLGLDFEIRPAQGEEVITKFLPEEAVKELAFQKAEEITRQLFSEYYAGDREMAETPVTVIGADTVVIYENRIFGKPSGRQDAIDMLVNLQGNTHQVFTGVCVMTLFSNREDATEMHVKEFAEKTDVVMYPMSASEIASYVDTGEPMDKAGAYAIQGISARYIKEIHGDYYNVVGLPMARLWQECFRD